MLMGVSDMGPEPALKDRGVCWHLETLPVLLTATRTHVWSLGSESTWRYPDIPVSPCPLSLQPGP